MPELGHRRRLLVIASGEVGARMAGNAIRSYELARALRAHADVTLAGISSNSDPDFDLPFVAYTREDLRPLRRAISDSEAVLGQPQWPLPATWLRRSGARLITDLYDPEPFEVAEFTAGRDTLVRRLALTLTLDRVIGALRASHHAICASEKQRDLWIGAMLAERLIGVDRYQRDSSLRESIDVVPFGLPDEPARPAGPGPRTQFPQIGPDDEIVLWNGGIWSWLDAPTAIHAADLLRQKRPGVRLVFMGGGDHSAGREAGRMARQLAADLGLLDTTVFFNEEWVPYDERSTWLLEAECAVSSQTDHLETRFAFRTRILDCFWARLPVVCTEGDDLAARVERDDLGAAVPQGEPSALAAALDHVLERGRAAYEPQLSAVAAEYRWARVVEPIARWLAAPVLPPRIGVGGRQRPGHAVRSAAFAMSHGLATTLGLRFWPRL